MTQPPTPDDYPEDALRTMEAGEELSRLTALWLDGHYYDYCWACDVALTGDIHEHNCEADGRSTPVVTDIYSADGGLGVTDMVKALGPNITIDRQGEGTDYLVEVHREAEYLATSGQTLSEALAGACALCWKRGWAVHDE